MAEHTAPTLPAATFDVAYIMTHYPRLALTFIASEIDELERQGARIFPIAMNVPSSADLSPDMARERHRRTLYLKARPPRILSSGLRTLIRHPLKLSRLTLTAMKSAGFDIGLAMRRLAHLSYATLVAQHCRESGLHHLHAHFGLAPATIAWFACEILNFDGEHGHSWSFTIHGFQDFINESEARLDLKAASARSVICVSDFTKSQLCRVTEFKYWKRFHVVRCGIDLAAFPLRQRRPMRRIPRIVVLGRLSPEKGHGILIEAVAKLANEKISVEVEIIGDGPFLGAIRDEETALGVEKCVRHLGELSPDEVSHRLADADIFCMPSFSEGLPISIMEAMAVGVPVVSTWISGIPELAVDGVTAVTVPPGNSDALATAIKRLMSDESLCDRLVVAARGAVERKHSRETNAQELAGLFRKLLPSTATS